MMTETNEMAETNGDRTDDVDRELIDDSATSTDADPTGDDGRAEQADRRDLGAIAHLSAFVAVAGVPSFVGPLVVWLVHRDRDRWVAEQARDALNFNLSLLIYAGAALLLSLVTIGLGLLVTVPAAIAAAIAWLVLTVLAALRAAEGERYRYPLTLELIR